MENLAELWVCVAQMSMAQKYHGFSYSLEASSF